MKKLRLWSQPSSEGEKLGFEPKAIFSLLPWFYCGCSRRLLVAGEELMHAFWMCWVGGAHETSRRRVEFGGWGRRIEKEFVSGSYTLTSACCEHQVEFPDSNSSSSSARLLCSVCGFLDPSSEAAVKAFFFFFCRVVGPLSTTCTNSAFSIFLKGLCNLLSYGSPLRCASVRYWVVWHWVK